MMDDVKRYDPEGDGGVGAWCAEASDGNYVTYDDFAALRARLEETEKERDAERAFFGTREAALADARRDAMLEAAEVCDRNATAIRDAIGENPLIKKRMVLLKRAEQSDADAAAIRALATQRDKG